MRICDAQTRGEESFALAGLIAACIAQTALDYDEHGYDGAGAPLRDREIEENLWRAIRHGMSGKLIDFRAGGEDDRGPGGARAAARLDRAGALAARHRAACRSATAPSARARRSTPGSSIEDVYRDAVAETHRTYTADAARVDRLPRR